MQERHYRSILYFISFVILITLGIQGYWNYKNYQATKQQLINEVQISLDNAVETYYVNLAEENLIGLSISDEKGALNPLQLDSIFTSLDRSQLLNGTSSQQTSITIDNENDHKSISIFTSSEVPNEDTLFKKVALSRNVRQGISRWHTTGDLTSKSPLNELTTRVIFAMTTDTMRVATMDSLVTQELERKKLDLEYGISFINSVGEVQVSGEELLNKEHLTTETKSEYLPKNSRLQLHFSNITIPVLRRSVWGFLFSLLLVSAVIGCLLYLLRIIRHQKQLSEVKNDLISNITHEFKTPIATIGAAVEGIQHFNSENDPIKNKRYADISSQQLDKLNAMVEKLLETATLDGDSLPLQFERVNIVVLLGHLVMNEAFTSSEKQICFISSSEEIYAQLDTFHFENAVNNIIDNAIKYGGQDISVQLKKHRSQIEITVQDSGTGLHTAQAKQLFEKFYRVPKGNTHDVKGFGIGLFYTKKIIERHHGTIQVTTRPSTTFIIHIPYED